jgi:predicted esterase
VTLEARTPGALLAYAPVKHGTARTVVYLHGVHGKAENGCPWMRAGAADVGWLVCPRGVRIDDGPTGTASWGSDLPVQGAVVAHALRAAEAAGASPEPGIAVGFSQGAYVALDLVKTRLGRFRGLVLLGAPSAHPSARRLIDAGVARIALGAGSLDPAYPIVQADVARLASEGIEARFVDLGRVGHTYVAEDPDALSDAIAWAGGGKEPRES